MSCQGQRTLLAPALQMLNSTLREHPNQSHIVFVISDGHTFYLPLLHACAAVADVVRSSSVAFLLFRFFKGARPDNVAFAAAASLGNIGTPPWVDCYPPGQWTCSACTVLNPFMLHQCKLCNKPRPDGMEDSAGENDSLRIFVERARASFMPLIDVCAQRCVRVVFETPSADLKEIVFTEKPLGLDFEHKAPVRIKKVYPGSHSEYLGVESDWTVKKLDGRVMPGNSFDVDFQCLSDAVSKKLRRKE